MDRPVRGERASGVPGEEPTAQVDHPSGHVHQFHVLVTELVVDQAVEVVVRPRFKDIGIQFIDDHVEVADRDILHREGGGSGQGVGAPAGFE